MEFFYSLTNRDLIMLTVVESCIETLREVYIIDWGLADYYKPRKRFVSISFVDEKYNVRVSTRHYKGPELLTNDTVGEQMGL